MVVAVVLGLLVGAGSFLPLLWGMRLARKASPTSNLGHAGALLLGVFASFVIVAVAMVICVIAFRDVAVPFTVGEAVALIGVATVYGFSRLVRK